MKPQLTFSQFAKLTEYEQTVELSQMDEKQKRDMVISMKEFFLTDFESELNDALDENCNLTWIRPTFEPASI